MYHVYILCSARLARGALYTGITGDLHNRIWQHRHHALEGFTRQYGVDRLVYLEAFNDVRAAIAREKQIKRWRREKKITLIETQNPRWKDLAAGWQ